MFARKIQQMYKSLIRFLSIMIIFSIIIQGLISPKSANAQRLRIGIEAGHSDSAPGAPSCDGSVNEKDITKDVALLAAQLLRDRGFDVDVFRDGLNGTLPKSQITKYKADAFIALHTDYCAGTNTGFKVSRYGGVAGTGKKGNGDTSDRLVDFMWTEYGSTTNLPEDLNASHFTENMLYYWALNPSGGIDSSTPGAIIEMGWLSGDFEFMTSSSGKQKMANGIANGAERFLRGSLISERYVIFLDGVNSNSTGTSPLNGDFNFIEQALVNAGISNDRFVYFSYGAAAGYQVGDAYCAGWQDGCSPSSDLTDLHSLPIYESEDTHLDVSLQANALEWLIGQITKRDPYAQIDIVGFSLGGITASYWGSHNGITSPYRSHVHGIIALESPLGGIPIASQCVDPINPYLTCLVLRHKYGTNLLRELQIPGDLPGSIVDELPDVARNFNFTSIQSSTDYTVNGLSFPLDGGIYGNLDVLIGTGSQYWVSARHTLHMNLELGGKGKPTSYIGVGDAINWIAINHGEPLKHYQTAIWIIEAIRKDPTPVTKMINQGINYLRNQHKLYPNGSWSNNVGITGLATLAFLNHGIKETDVDVHSAIAYLLSAMKPDGSIYFDSSHITYETSIAILALKATQNSAYSDEISRAKSWLVNSQWDEQFLWGSINQSDWRWGGFGYGNNGRPDLSNSQFALLALDAAELPKTDPAWAKALVFTSRCQNRITSNDGYSFNNDGGFNYLPGSSVAYGTLSIGSTTGAGIWSLALSGLSPTDPRFADALKWVENNYSWDYNPPPGGNWSTGMQYYYYLSMSKALSMARKTNIGGSQGSEIHNWYEDLRIKLSNLQKPDGSWVNTNNWVWETIPELTTSYALLSLQTRQLPKNADLEMVIIIHSPADIHLYDAQGRHVGKNYGTGTIDLEIIGATYSENDSQTIRISQPEAGNYHLELIGTAEDNWQLEIIGYQDGNQVSYETYYGAITPAAVQATDLNVGAFEGGLTIFSSQPVAAAVMNVSPSSLILSGGPGDTLPTNFTLNETGGSEAIQGIGIFATDLEDGLGHIIPEANVTCTPSAFDLSAGNSQTVDCSIAIPADVPSGDYTGAINIESLNAGTKSISLSVDVNTNLPPALVTPIEGSGQYSDLFSLIVEATDPNDPVDSLTFSATGLPAWLTLTDNHDGTATISGIATAAPGTYTADITVTDPGGLSDTKPLTMTVTPEDARLTYTGPMLVSTACATCATATVPLRLTIQDITAATGDPAYDEYPGDITKATVSFVDRVKNTTLCTAALTLLNPADTKVASAACDWTPDIGTAQGMDFTVGIVVNNYYVRNDPLDDTVVVVSKPGTNFITGGGYLVNQSSAGTYAGDAGLKTNFGFNIKFNKAMTNLQGKATIIIRQGGRVYQIKTNVLTSLAVVPYNVKNPASGTAELLAKANVVDVTDPLNPISLTSSATLQIKMKDKGEPGNTDLLSITLWSKDGKLLFSSSWNGVKTIEQTLQGGNLQVH